MFFFLFFVVFFFFKQKTAYEIVTGDWSSDVCSSDLIRQGASGGELRIKYGDLEQLDELCRRLTAKRS